MNLLQRLKMQLNGYIYVGHRTRPGWTGSLPFYRFTCPIHGPVENYPQGYSKTLYCPHCQESRREATKRIDPKMNVLADEPKTAKSVRPTQVKKSEREISENREVR